MSCIVMYFVFPFNFSICNRQPWLVLSFKYIWGLCTMYTFLYNVREWWIVANGKSKRKPQKSKNKKNYFRMRIERIYAKQQSSHRIRIRTWYKIHLKSDRQIMYQTAIRLVHNYNHIFIANAHSKISNSVCTSFVVHNKCTDAVDLWNETKTTKNVHVTCKTRVHSINIWNLNATPFT